MPSGPQDDLGGPNCAAGRPGRRDRRRRPLLTRCDLPRKWGPSDPLPALPALPALPSGPSSCPVRAPEDPVGTSPQRSAQPPLSHTLIPSRLRRTTPPPHGHRSGSLPAWASLRVPMPHPILCLSVPPSIPPSAQRPPHHTLRDAPLRAKGWRGARQPRLGGSVPDWPAQRACGRRDLGRDTPPGPTAAQALVPRVEGRGSRIENRRSRIEDPGLRPGPGRCSSTVQGRFTGRLPGKGQKDPGVWNR